MLYPRATVAPATPDAGYLLNLNTGDAPPRSLFDALPYERLLPVVISSVEAHTDLHAGHLADNAVLNACRALRFPEDRRWYAKQAAGRRTLAAAGPYPALLREALASFERGERRDGSLPADAVRGFLGHVLAELHARC